MFKLALPAALKKAAAPILTKKLFYGAAIACVAGVGLGAWLEPPKTHYGSATTVVTPLPDPPNVWGETASDVSTLPDSPLDAGPVASQSAAVSPPAVDDTSPPVKTIQVAQADPRQVAASGDTSHAQPDVDADAPQPAVYTQPAPQGARPQPRDWASYDSRPRDNEDFLDAGPPAGRPAPPPQDRAAPPPPPRREAPPDASWRPSMQDRHWDFRPDGSAVPRDDQDEGDGG